MANVKAGQVLNDGRIVVKVERTMNAVTVWFSDKTVEIKMLTGKTAARPAARW